MSSISDLHGDQGLFKLRMLATTCKHQEFKHFYSMILSDVNARPLFSKIPLQPLAIDNNILRSSEDINAVAHNVVTVSLSRKFFNPGTHHGFVVYGLGGPRILLSLPFIGGTRYGYELYNNSVDVITSLMLRGYFGTFLSLDLMMGLNKQYFGKPGWLVFFSLVAAHSDLVIFIKEEGQELSPAQYEEARFTSERNPKKIVEFKSGELNGVRAARRSAIFPVVDVGNA